jgi:crotonobetainyl-CoA:carnitine CoA-transferase CaiB-like acyl-CoA transferase
VSVPSSPAPGAPAPSPAEPLAGFRVLDLTTFLSGPLATRSLAALGATVAKVEPPSGGDPTRVGWGVAGREGPPLPFWLALHRDRQGVVLDLKVEAGRRVFLDLVAQADALVENFRPGVMERLGLATSTLRERFPRLVSCSITGFGPDGPVSQLAAIDGPIQAFSGLLELTGRDGQPGAPVPMQVADIAGASYAAQAVLAALLARERTGRGAHVELSLVECVLQWLGVIDRAGTLLPPATLVLEAAGGEPVLVQPIMHFHPRFAALVAAVPGCEGFAEDPRFADRDRRSRHREAYEEIVRTAFRSRSRADWLADLHGAGVPAAPVQRFDDVLDHPQLEHRRAATEVDVPSMGATRVLAPPFVFDGVRRMATTPPPTLGQDTRAVLGEWLGWSDDRFAAAAADGAFGPA